VGGCGLRKVSSDAGGHEIIIRGQIPDYVSNIGITFDLPSEISGRILRGGYTVFLKNQAMLKEP
jgi:hypothetical protein